MHKLKSESLKVVVRELLEDGIFLIADIAAGAGLTAAELQEQMTDEIIRMCGMLRIAHKAKLNRILMTIAEKGDQMDQTRVIAAKYLLASLHDQSESSNYYREKIREEKKKRQIDQTIKAASLSTQWDESTTMKFIQNVRNIGDLLQ